LGQATSVVTADFNEDGRLDLAVSNGFVEGPSGGSAVSILLGKADGTFEAHVDYLTAPAPQFLGEGQIIAADFNGDKKADLALVCANGVSILLGNGDGKFGPHLDFVPAAHPGGSPQ
jgi:hypothetical protein